MTAGEKQEEQPGYDELVERNRELEARLKGRGGREYKSRLFGFIFGREEHKDWTLSLYNAVNKTKHTDPSDLVINTMEDVVYLGMKNDLSILVSETVSLYSKMEVYEQQSTPNPNIPVREFMYAGKLYDKYLYMSKFNRYGTKLIPLPIPKLVVFYNGESKADDEVTLRLSDSFREEIRRNIGEKLSGQELEAEVDRRYAEADPDIEVKVRMININKGHNKEILTTCKPLGEYSWFVAKIREYNHPIEGGGTLGIEEAINRALDEMPEDFVIREFLVSNRAEVTDMCLTEYNETEVMELFKAEGRAEGRAEGLEEGLAKGLAKGKGERDREKITDMLRRGKTPDAIAEFCGYAKSLIEDVQRGMVAAV